MPKPPAETALYVRIPTPAITKLRRAAEALGIHNKDLVAGLVNHYVDPDSRRGLDALTALTTPMPTRGIGSSSDGPRLTVGQYSFHPVDPPEVMTAEQAAQFLQVAEAVVVEMADAGELPGRKLGKHWRFSRAALAAWLAQPPVE